MLTHLIFHVNGIHITLQGLGLWLVFNNPFQGISGTCWFLFALLYAYALYGLFESLKWRKYAYILAAAMFVVYVVLAQGMHLVGVHVPNMVYRNWLVEAFPYFMLGHWIHEHQDSIHISNRTLIAIIAVTTLLCWVERWMMGRDFGVNIVTIPQVFALFVYGVKNPTRHKGIIQRLGRDSSMLVYILHPAVWHSAEIVYSKVGWTDNMPALYLMPVLVLGISIVLSILFNKAVAAVQRRPAIA